MIPCKTIANLSNVGHYLQKPHKWSHDSQLVINEHSITGPVTPILVCSLFCNDISPYIGKLATNRIKYSKLLLLRPTLETNKKWSLIGNQS